MNQQVSNETKTWVRDLCLIAGLFLIFYTLWLGSYPFFTPDEGRYGEIAREMVATGDYITPRINGIAFLDKPVLYYWLQALSIHWFGVKEWSLRLFPVLFALVGTLMTYLTGRLLYSRRTALIASIVLATTPLYFIGAHYANLDLEVASLISCSLFCTLIALEKAPWRTTFILLAYTFAGLAILTKGLIGLLFPLAITGLWITLTHRWYLITKLHPLAGIFIMTAINLPWYILAQRANPNFLHYFFIVQHVSRFLSQGEFNNVMPFWFYLPVTLLGGLPWTGYALGGIAIAIRERATNTISLFLLIWIGVILVFFSIPSSKIITYILPLYPPLALLAAAFINTRWNEQQKQIILSLASVTAVTLLILVLNAHYLNDRSAKPIVQYLKSKLQAQDAVINYYAFHQDVPLYLGRTIQLVANWDDPRISERDNWMRELWLARPYQDTSKQLILEDAFWRKWKSEQRVFVILNDNYFGQFKAQAAHFYILKKHGDIFLLSNQL